MQILILQNGEQHGPYTEDEVRQHLAQGSFLPSDLGWHEGLDGWVALREIVAAPKFKVPPPPPPIDATVQQGNALTQPSLPSKKRASAMAKLGLPLFFVLIGAAACPFVISWHNSQTIRNASREIELNPNNYQAYIDRGEAYASNHDYDRAIADYSEAKRLCPVFSGLYQLLIDRVKKEKADQASWGWITPPSVQTFPSKNNLTRESALALLKQSPSQQNALRLQGTGLRSDPRSRIENPDENTRFLLAAEANGLITFRVAQSIWFNEWQPMATAKAGNYCTINNQGGGMTVGPNAQGSISEFIMALPEPTEVTGIGAPSPMEGKTISVVNFKFNYIPTPFGTAFANATGVSNRYAGWATGVAVFTLYDDGWHLEGWRQQQ